MAKPIVLVHVESLLAAGITDVYIIVQVRGRVILTPILIKPYSYSDRFNQLLHFTSHMTVAGSPLLFLYLAAHFSFCIWQPTSLSISGSPLLFLYDCADGSARGPAVFRAALQERYKPG